MEQVFKYIIYIVLAVSVISLAFTLFGNNDIKKIRKDLQNATRSADSALSELKYSRNTIDSLHADLTAVQQYITSIQKMVYANHLAKTISDAKSDAEIKAAKARLDSLNKDIKTDSLPPTFEKPLKKHP